MKASSEASSGSWPKATEKSWYWPGLMVPLVQVTSETASVMVPSSVVTGVLSLVVVVVAVQPGIGPTRTPRTGWSVGKKTWTFVVLAPSSSLGTRKVRVPSVAPLA